VGAFYLCKLSIGFQRPFRCPCLCPAKSRFPAAETVKRFPDRLMRTIACTSFFWGPISKWMRRDMTAKESPKSDCGRSPPVQANSRHRTCVIRLYGAVTKP
jgi:hypothetical protein